MLTGGGFGLFFTPLAAVSAFVAAMIGRSKGRYWWAAAGIDAILIAGWYVFETGRIVWYFPVMHAVSLLTLLVLRDRIAGWIDSDDRRWMTIGLLVCSFVSTVAGHMLGNLIFIVMLAPDPSLFVAIMVVSVFERVGITIGATLFAASLLVAVRRVYPELLD
jgi:hypothetical protein